MNAHTKIRIALTTALTSSFVIFAAQAAWAGRTWG